MTATTKAGIFLITGLILLSGVAGGLDTASDADLMPLALVALAGFVSMIIGASYAQE